MRSCFIIMPFKPELHYMYLFMKQHIESTFQDVACERGDEKILTVPLLDKIVGYIQAADVIVADCTDRNPNVFYELGMAHALNKPVILITGDPIDTAPSDIRCFEFIHYKLDDHKGFVEKLDRALGALLGNQFDEHYDKMVALFDEFRTASHLHLAKVSKDKFAAAAAEKARSGLLPSLDDDKALAKVLLPVVIEGPPDLDVMLRISQWIEQKFEDDNW